MTQRQLVETLFVPNKAVSKFIVRIDERFFLNSILHWNHKSDKIFGNINSNHLQLQGSIVKL